jgi:hypothetical protein
MTRVEPGGDAVGIDPQWLQSMTSQMSSSAGDALNLVNGYIGQMSRVGLDTSRLNRAVQDLTWAQGQVPMLNRRQSLAQMMAQQNPGLTEVTAGAGSLGNFATNAAAQQAGQRDAQDFKNGDLSVQQLYAKLAANQGDAAYCTALIKELGADRLREIEQDAPYDPNDPGGTETRYVLAQAVAAAMWNGVTFAEPAYEKSMDGALGREDPELLSGLLQYATFPPQVLADLGTACTAPGEYQYGNLVWQALSAAPTAAALFVQQNATVIPQWIAQGSDHSGGLPDDQAGNFLQVIQAGTIGARTTDPRVAAQAVTALVTAYDKNTGTHTTAQFDALYGQVIRAYWPDIMYSINAPAPGAAIAGLSPDGLPLKAEQWAPFVDEAMRDPQTSATLLVTAHAQAKEFQLASATTGNNYYDYQAGLTSGFFDRQAAQVYADEKSAAEAWKEQVASYTDKVIGIAVDTVFDPGDAAKTIAEPVVEGVVSSLAGSFLNNGLQTAADNLKPPDYYGQQSANANQARDDFSKNAVKTLETGQKVSFPVSTVYKYDGGSFVHNGQIDPQTPAELRAYDQWLQDPAVVAYVWGDSQNLMYDTAYAQETSEPLPSGS